MRHYQTPNGVFRADADPLLEQVFSILDSRIQFIDHQVQRYFTSCTSNINTTSSEAFTYCGPSSSKTLDSNLDQLLDYTEKLQNDLKLLQTLKAWLKDETVQDILELLTNNKYLGYSEENLAHLLKQKAMIFYPLTMEIA